MIFNVMRQSLAYHCLEIWNHQSWCQVCCPVTSWSWTMFFFSRELFSRGCLQTYMLTYSGTISPILFLSPWKLTKSTRAEWPLTLYMQFPAPQRILSTLWDHQVPAGPDVQQLLTPVTARITGHSPPPCVITTVHGVLRQRSAELPAPGRETSSPAGGCSYPTCRAFYLVSSNLYSRFQELQKVPHRSWSLCIGFSWSRILRKKLRSKTVNHWWFFSHMFRLSDYSFTVQEPQVWVAFPTSSGSHSDPGCRFFETLQSPPGCVKPES